MSVAPLQTETALAPTGVALYARFALAGAICCGVTHGSLTPVDVVKTRIQLDSKVYNKVRNCGFYQKVSEDEVWARLGAA
ncbi:mitochondrial phosphate carrier protein [Gamsiella multidivaricata]|nr:mitochondrial phosphate carrier protein [Gamsiella multidivaricata]